MDTKNQNPDGSPITDPMSKPVQYPLDVPAQNQTSPLAGLGLPNPGEIPAPLSGQSASSDPEPAPSTLGGLAAGFTSALGAIFSWVVFPVAVVLILHNFVFQAYHVVGTSMVPTLQNKDYLIISKIGYTGSLVNRVFNKDGAYIPKRGEIIVFHYPKDPREAYVKRVLGLPGDRIVVKDGSVTVYSKDQPNGFNPDKSYGLGDASTTGNIDETVQAGNVFVIGDNRAPGGSYDSREWGELPSSFIIGNAVLRLLPLDQAKVL